VTGRGANAVLVLLAASTIARANGRPPATSSIQFRAEHETDVLLGMTFGVVLSHDDGVTWQWMCEAAVGYGGIYDPRFLWFPSGVIFATTTTGLRVSRDGCTFAETPAFGTKFVSAIARGPDNALYVAVSSPTDTNIYKSTDEGLTFPRSAPGPANTWWQSLAVAPSDPNRIYLAGWQFTSDPPKTLLLRRSLDGGRTFSELSFDGFDSTSDTSIEIAAISPTDPDLVFVHVTNQRDANGDRIYRSSDGGKTFTKVLDVGDSPASLVLRRTGEILVAAPKQGMRRSTDGGVTFQAIEMSPALHARCLVESASGTLWACGENYADEHVGVARSADGMTWTKALRYQDISQPVACATGTPQQTCTVQSWCTLRTQLGVTANPTSCPAGSDSAKPDPRVKPAPKGCCDSGRGSSTTLAALVVGATALRRRRRRR